MGVHIGARLNRHQTREIVFVQFVTPNATLHYMRKDGAVDVQTDKLLRSLVNCISAPTRDILSKWELLR